MLMWNYKNSSILQEIKKTKKCIFGSWFNVRLHHRRIYNIYYIYLRLWITHNNSSHRSLFRFVGQEHLWLQYSVYYLHMPQSRLPNGRQLFFGSCILRWTSPLFVVVIVFFTFFFLLLLSSLRRHQHSTGYTVACPPHPPLYPSPTPTEILCTLMWIIYCCKISIISIIIILKLYYINLSFSPLPYYIFSYPQFSHSYRLAHRFHALCCQKRAFCVQ